MKDLERRALDPNQRLLSTEQVMKYYQVGKNKARQIGYDSGAAVKLGKRLLFDKGVLDSYIDKHYIA